MAARLVDQLAQLLLGVAVDVDQLAVGFGFLDRVQVLPLDILQQSDLERLDCREIPNDNRYVVNTSALRGAPAALAGDDLVAIVGRPDDDRLDQPAGADR